MRAVPILDGNGRLEGLIEIVRDTTTLKRLEEQVRQAQKMESVGTLAGGIALVESSIEAQRARRRFDSESETVADMVISM